MALNIWRAPSTTPSLHLAAETDSDRRVCESSKLWVKVPLEVAEQTPHGFAACSVAVDACHEKPSVPEAPR